MESEVVTLYVYPHQVSGKEPKLISQDHSQVLKGLNQNQLAFYRKIFRQASEAPCPGLRPFLPTFHGTLQLNNTPRLLIESEERNDWLTHLASRYSIRNEKNSFIVLQNLTLGYAKPCVFDIKIGGRNIEGKKHKITKSVAQFFLKLNGCRIADVNGKEMLMSKYFMGEAVEWAQIIQYFVFFLARGDLILQDALRAIKSQITQMVEVFKEFKGYRFISSSLCLMYDSASPSKTDVRLIDFGRIVEENEDFVDQQSLQGIQNILKIISSIGEDLARTEESIPLIRQKYLESQVLHIPEHKKSKPSSSL